MKKNYRFFILIMLIGFVSCDTVTHYAVRVSVDKNPTLIIINQTGYPVVVTAPVPSNINNGERTQFQPTETNRSIGVTYSIGQIQFTEQVIMADSDATVTLTKRPPTITVVNQTGYPVNLTAPEHSNIGIGESGHFLAPALNRSVGVTYTVGQMSFTEQVTMANQDVTVTLTRRPPTITVVNNVGATINTLFLRTPGAPVWTGGNIVMRNGVAIIVATGAALTADISTSIVNGDTMRIWMGNVSLSGDRFDVRVDDVQGNAYVKSNVQFTNDITLTFTRSDRP
jgi:hypothetical protein